jgi:hypothetical protein
MVRCEYVSGKGPAAYATACQLEIGAFEAKNKLGQLPGQVENGEEILITRRGDDPPITLDPESTPHLWAETSRETFPTDLIRCRIPRTGPRAIGPLRSAGAAVSVRLFEIETP